MTAAVSLRFGGHCDVAMTIADGNAAPSPIAVTRRSAASCATEPTSGVTSERTPNAATLEIKTRRARQRLTNGPDARYPRTAPTLVNTNAGVSDAGETMNLAAIAGDATPIELVSSPSSSTATKLRVIATQENVDERPADELPSAMQLSTESEPFPRSALARELASNTFAILAPTSISRRRVKGLSNFLSSSRNGTLGSIIETCALDHRHHHQRPAGPPATA